ncbi:MAG: hypothetical protein OXH59_02525 [Rhodospirillaceae bacterium]|nr:hypothetical protein [Rhodospirillaceae bacterium]
MRYDNRDLAHLDLAAVRRQIGMVMQDGSLMADGTTLDNIIGVTGSMEAASSRLEASTNWSPRMDRFVIWLRGK